MKVGNILLLVGHKMVCKAYMYIIVSFLLKHLLIGVALHALTLAYDQIITCLVFVICEGHDAVIPRI